MYLETSFLTNWVTPTQLGWDKYFCSNSLVNSFYTIFHLVCYFKLSNILTSFLKKYDIAIYWFLWMYFFPSLEHIDDWIWGRDFESFWENKTRKGLATPVLPWHGFILGMCFCDLPMYRDQEWVCFRMPNILPIVIQNDVPKHE